MESQRYLRCLGQPGLFAATGEPIRFRTRKHLALLVYIAVEARSHRRDRLAELLWPKVSTSEARHSLATALSTLRPRLGLEGLESGRDHVRLLPGRVILDLERLQSGDVLGSEVTGPLEVAGFLEGFDITDSAEFTHWKDRQQARLLPVIKDALLVLIDRCRRTGDTRQIEQLADRMLALDELCEEAIRAKMEARAFAGDRLTALEIFEEWKDKLAEELHAAPSDLLEGMAVRLRRRGWERTTLTNIPNVPTDQWRGRPFIGRTAEYRVLYELWEGVKKGIPGHALILGDSGVGKTTLVQRLTTAAGLEGAAISRVQCYDIEHEIPYSTLSGLVIGLLDRPGISATSPEALAELSRTVPEVRHRFLNIPKPSDSQGETARIRLTESLLEMLTAIADEHPVILNIDDLHLADDVSLAVLHLIMRRSRGRAIMVLLAARPGEFAQTSYAVRLRESAADLGIHEIELSTLSDTESREMLRSLIQSDEPQPSPIENRALLRAAAGYPMVLELLVQDWKVSGARSLALSVDAMTADFGTHRHALGSYRQILDRITRSLSTTTHNVLNLASVLGHRLNDLSLYALVDLTTSQTMSSMAELVALRVLRDGAQGLEFVNELVRAAAYLGVPQTLRRILHGNIADRFIQQHASGHEDLGLEIAWHCMRAGRVDQATQYLLCGAREAMREGALYSAERALVTAIPRLADAERREAVLLLAEILQEQGRWLDSLDLLRQSDPNDTSAAVLVLSLIADYWSTSPTTERILDQLGQLRSVIEDSSHIHIHIKAASAVALMVNSLRDADQARIFLKCINQIPTTSLDLDDLASLAESKARLLYNAMERGPCLQEIVQIADKLRKKRHINSTVGSLHTGIGAVHVSEGRYADAKTEFLRSYEIYASLGNDTIRGSRAAQVALCHFRLGEYTDALEWSSRAVATFGGLFAGYLECQAGQYIGCSHAFRGEDTRALSAIDQVDLRMPQTVPAWIKQAWLLHKADILLLVGQRSRALTVAREAIGQTPVLYSSFFAGIFARWLALTSIGNLAEPEARTQLTLMIQELEKFDALDHVEILCARNILGCESKSILEDSTRIIQEKLADLPTAITNQLARLGVLACD